MIKIILKLMMHVKGILNLSKNYQDFAGYLKIVFSIFLLNFY